MSCNIEPVRLFVFKPSDICNYLTNFGFYSSSNIIEIKMKSFRKELWYNIKGRRAFINITSEVESCLYESGVKEGFVLVNAMHITASVFINDDEHGLHHDYEMWLEELAPHDPVSHYYHNRTWEDNGDAHLKRQVMGREVVVLLLMAGLTLAPGSRFFMVNLTAEGKNVFWSK